jgi:hypothetical protein
MLEFFQFVIADSKAFGIVSQGNINYATDFGHDLAKQCTWVMKAEKTGFKAVSPQPYCGTDIPGTSES